MSKKATETLTESMFYVLMAIVTEPMCGIEVVKYIETRTKGRVAIGPGTLYTILGKFVKESWIKEIEKEGRKRTYQITAKGVEVYEQEVRRLQCCVQDTVNTKIERFIYENNCNYR